MSTEWLIRVQGYVRRDEGDLPVDISVSHATLVAGEAEYRCRVNVSPFLSKVVEIAGVDSGQAEELAVKFVRSIVGGESIEDEYGQQVDW